MRTILVLGQGRTSGIRVVGRSLAVAIVLCCLLAPSVSAQGLAPPTAPQNVQVEATSDGALVSWDAPAWDGGSPVLYYNVYRGETVIAQVTSTLYVDSSAGMAAAAQTSYFVTAVNEVGESVAGGHTGACLYLEPTPPTVDPMTCAFLVVDFLLWVIGNITP